MLLFSSNPTHTVLLFLHTLSLWQAVLEADGDSSDPCQPHPRSTVSNSEVKPDALLPVELHIKYEAK